MCISLLAIMYELRDWAQAVTRTRPIPVFVDIGLDCLEAAIMWADIKTNRLW